LTVRPTLRTPWAGSRGKQRHTAAEKRQEPFHLCVGVDDTKLVVALRKPGAPDLRKPYTDAAITTIRANSILPPLDPGVAAPDAAAPDAATPDAGHRAWPHCRCGRGTGSPEGRWRRRSANPMPYLEGWMVFRRPWTPAKSWP
jgi:hypothetical protein